ncbi:MAG: hypothetical protein QM504_07960, partial [Pseudomonadota bacterium]
MSKVEVNSFKKTIAKEHKIIYENAAKNIGCSIEYEESISDWDNSNSKCDIVYLCGEFSEKDEDCFEDEIIRETQLFQVKSRCAV